MIKYCSNCGQKLVESSKFCSKCGTEIGNSTRSNDKLKKHDKVISNKKRNFNLVNILLLVGLIITIAIYMGSTNTKEYKIIKEQPNLEVSAEYPNYPTSMVDVKATIENGLIKIPVKYLQQSKFVRFNYSQGSSTLPLLAYLSEEGQVVTAVSMCEPCNSTSFHIKGSELVCNSCGTTWDLNTLDSISGSCGKYPPDPIPSKVVNGEIQISVKNVQNWQRRV